VPLGRGCSVLTAVLRAPLSAVALALAGLPLPSCLMASPICRRADGVVAIRQVPVGRELRFSPNTRELGVFDAHPCPADDMICWSVRVRVDNVKNNDPSLMEPIAAVG
jgi:hypothetical protein